MPMMAGVTPDTEPVAVNVSTLGEVVAAACTSALGSSATANSTGTYVTSSPARSEDLRGIDSARGREPSDSAVSVSDCTAAPAAWSASAAGTAAGTGPGVSTGSSTAAGTSSVAETGPAGSTGNVTVAVGVASTSCGLMVGLLGTAGAVAQRQHSETAVAIVSVTLGCGDRRSLLVAESFTLPACLCHVTSSPWSTYASRLRGC